MSGTQRSGWGETVLLVAAWAAAIVAIHPRGDFPLNDDWDFAIATWNFARTGHYQFTHFTAMSLRAFVPWGAMWTRLFGESFEVLRLSTLTLAAVLIVVVNRFLRAMPLGTTARVIATLAVAFHPIFLWASCTYMTEVPFVLCSMLAMLAFWRGIAHDDWRWITAGCVAAMTSWFIRQTGVTNLFAPFAILILYRREVSARWRRHAAIVGSFLLFFAILFVFKRTWLAGAPEEFANHFEIWKESSFHDEDRVAFVYHYTIFNVENAALFLLPLTAPLLLLLRRRTKWEYFLLALSVLFVFARTQSLINVGHPMPYFASDFCCDMMPGNTLVDWGLGQQTLTDVWAMNRTYPVHLTHAARLALTYTAAATAALLLWAGFLSLLNALAEPRRYVFLLLAIGAAMFGTAALFGSGLYVDRYAFDSAWSIVFIAPLLVPWRERAARWISIAVLCAVMLFSVGAVNDYFAWNRARWTAFHALRARGVPVAQIDAGSEPFNFYEISPLDQRGRRRLLWHAPRPYMVAFNPLPGYAIDSVVPYSGWLGWNRGKLYVLRKL